MESMIRSWRIEDAEALALAINNKKIMENLRDGIPYPYTVDDAKDYIRDMLDGEKKNRQYAFAITLDGKAIGSIGIFRKDNIHRYTAELGYYVAEPYWGKGIVTQAVTEICDYVFANTDIMRIFAEPFARNIASCRVLEKAGFILEGTLRKNAVKNGEALDMRLYALVK
ncbi:MAG: N-acetyltransferase [Clostridia bacterium]|nr:N-acetyltransferase [Clostridia bacterium]